MEKKPRWAHLHIIQQQYLAFSGISCSAIFEQLILNMSKKLNLVGQSDYQVMTAFKLISSKLDRRKNRLQCERFFQVKFITGFQFGQAPIPPRPRHWLGKKTKTSTPRARFACFLLSNSRLASTEIYALIIVSL